MYVKSVELVNVKGFEKLHFDFTRPDGSLHGWTVLVGGNASGKTTLLKALALGMTGPVVGRRLLGSVAGWLRQGESHGKAIVMVMPNPAIDQFKAQVAGVDRSAAFEAGVQWNADPGSDFAASRRDEQGTTRHAISGPWAGTSGWFSAGYGPMRRLSGSSSDAARDSSEGGAISRYVTLFRDDATLYESEAWLKLNHARQLESRSPQLRALLDGVHSLLNDGLLPYGMQISKTTVDHVFIRDSIGIELPMRDLSDGCRSIYAMVLDLLHGMAEVYGVDDLFGTDTHGRVVVARPGVVLIDEVEAHLHPKWQSDIPEWFKAHFPRVQFIVSTHSALVAQAADPNGVFVLPSPDDPGRAPRQLDPHEYELLRLRRAEKTLLGSAFGLKTTRSKWAIDQIERWKRLSAKARAGARLSAQEQSDLTELKAQMEVAFAESAPGGTEEATP